MLRESHLVPQKRPLSRRSSSKFFYLVDAIAKHHEPTKTQLDALKRSYDATGEYLMACDEFRELVMTVHAQGSREIGTIIRPLHHLRPDGFDIDLVVRLRRAALQKYGGDQGPGRLINDLFTVLKRYADRHGLAITRWERCVTLEYADGMCVDITPIIEEPLFSIPYGETHARVPDRALRLYEPSNPMGLASSFNKAARISPLFTHSFALDSAMESFQRAEQVPLPDADEVLDRLLSRLVQILKLHRNVAFGAPVAGQDYAPKSVFVTSLAAAAYTLRAPVPHDDPLDLLLDIVDTMPLCFERQLLGAGTEFWNLPNLTAPGDNLASGMNTPGHQAAFGNWHKRLTGHLQQLLQCIEQQGLDPLLRVVEDAFGERAAQAVRDLEAPRPMPHVTRKSVVATTAAATTFSMPARSHTFFGQ
jgi:hypothetical protein